MANILVVDDDKRITQFLCEQLTDKGHACSFETRGEPALERVDANSIDLLILDVMLPDVSGFEVCRRIRANTELYTLPILFLTSMDSEEEIKHGLAQGADDYVTKPFNTGALMSRIENLLASHLGTSLKDTITGLPTAKSIKLEIQKAINVHTEFVIGHVELMGLKQFFRDVGSETHGKALRHFGRCLHMSVRDIKPRFFSIGHMGGGHFVFIIPADAVAAYSERVNRVWERHLLKFLESCGKESQVKSWQTHNVLEFLMCVTRREKESTLSSRDLFEILSHLRSKAFAAGQHGLFQDRRL